MVDLSSELEMQIVASGLMGMLALGTWLFFRHDSKGEQSLFEIIRESHAEMHTPPTLISHARGSLRKRGLNVVLRIPATDHAVLDMRNGLRSLNR